MDERQILRFLGQATFGASVPDFWTVRAVGPSAWLDVQMSMPASEHRPLVAQLGTQPGDRQAVWWKHALTAPDQLRQRVAFALSEILVISDASDALHADPVGCAEFYDILVRGAFGSYRDLLRNVCLSPQMGRYLSHLRNAKANPAAGTTPDENFAREIMQLFSIGLWQLQPNGTRTQPETPSYTMADVTEMARVFTGWIYAGAISWWDYSANHQPMVAMAAFHDQGSKSILGTSLPANQGALADLDSVVNWLANHPNCAPFLSRLLIQRLTVSQPSPSYVADVASVWLSSNGNLGDVVRAILLHPEAQTGTKMREPILLQTAIWRVLGATSQSGQWRFDLPDYAFGQASLRAPSVFGWWQPDGTPAPEAAGQTHVTRMETINQLYRCLYEPADIRVDLSFLTALAAQSTAWLVFYVDVALRGGLLQSDERAVLEQHLAQIADPATRARDAVWIVMASPRAMMA